MALQLQPAQIVVVTTIYTEFIPYREWKSITPATLPTVDAINTDMKTKEYVRIDATKAVTAPDTRNLIVIIILSPTSKYAKSRAEFDSLISGINSERSSPTLQLSEVIIVADEENFWKKIKTVYKKSAHGTDDVTYNAYHYRNFVYIIPKHVSVPVHRIMSDEESKNLFRITGYPKSGLPIIFANDPPIIWLGGKVGQIVEITRVSQTACKSLCYRQIEPAP